MKTKEIAADIYAGLDGDSFEETTIGQLQKECADLKNMMGALTAILINNLGVPPQDIYNALPEEFQGSFSCNLTQALDQ